MFVQVSLLDRRKRGLKKPNLTFVTKCMNNKSNE